MKKIKAALLGAGNRGCVYSDYSLSNPEEMEIVAIIEKNGLRLKEAAERYNVARELCFSDLNVFLDKKISADVVINATMDEMHYETTVKLIDAGYDILLEKPITNNKKQLLDIQKRANDKGVKIIICHVLRYAPFYREAKKIIKEGKIGKILTIEMNEHVWIAHFLDSFVRGKWNSETKCGSSFLLQKSCHDTDLMCWLNNESTPKKVASFGSRALFNKDNMPAGATEFCYNCPHNNTCLYSAQKVHLEFDSIPFQTWAEMGKPIEEITKEEKAEHLKRSDYGRCAYNSGGDIVDRQVLSVEFENGSTVMFTMVGGTSKAGRYLHIVGAKGEIEGHLEDNAFALRLFDRSGNNFKYNETIIDFSKDVKLNAMYSGHGGGDALLIHDLVRYLNGDDSSISITNINDSINGHCLVFAAETSRLNGKVVDFKDFLKE